MHSSLSHLFCPKPALEDFMDSNVVISAAITVSMATAFTLTAAVIVSLAGKATGVITVSMLSFFMLHKLVLIKTINFLHAYLKLPVSFCFFPLVRLYLCQTFHILQGFCSKCCLVL